ncbi:unnamed protein product [Brassica oleracea var. botrytis]|uniref:Uncharacterized protein n=1 Tax=Brassica carinata TaxID=52824 RepID=A0A8X7U0J0_BRACI|nr:hypothetical protein Bca52824_079260 [Brassica carinata]
MGCCVSSLTADQKDDSISGKNTAPPPSVVEEETVVKEVLSETTLVTDNTTSNKVPENKEKKPAAVNVAPDPGLTVKPEKGSEICSLSENLLSIVNECNEEEAKQRKLHGVRERSPAKSRNRVMVHNYPTRITDMSPRKRNAEGGGEDEAGSVRLVPSVTGQRDPNKRSGRRRSRSVMIGPSRDHYCTDIGGENLSPGRVRPDPNKNGSDHHQWLSCGAAGDNDVSTPIDDSFENSLVTLECFIFL